MDDKDQEQNAKRQKQIDEECGNGSENAVAGAAVVVGAPNIQQTADIFKLNNDCFEAVFDYLLRDDLISVGRTCKRLNQVAGHCFRMNYSNMEVKNTSRGLQVFGHRSLLVNITHFAPFTHQIETSINNLKFLISSQSKLRRVKHIYILGGVFDPALTQLDIDRMKEMLNKIEEMHLDVYSSLTFHKIFAHCPNLRRFDIRNCSTGLRWLVGKCPTLESFVFVPDAERTVKKKLIEKIGKFLRENQNIRKFATTAEYLLKYRGLMENASGIRLDVLAISLHRGTDVVSLCHLLNELHGRGFFKQLQVYDFSSPDQGLDNLATVNGLVKLYLDKRYDLITLPTLNSLEELRVGFSRDIMNVENVAKGATNLQRIHFIDAYLNDLMPFIRRTAALDKIKIDSLLHEGIYFNKSKNIIDLVKLNGERAQLPDARKITLYVGEKFYLATKWALKETDFSLIRLKRESSFRWDHDFYL